MKSRQGKNAGSASVRSSLGRFCDGGRVCFILCVTLGNSPGDWEEATDGLGPTESTGGLWGAEPIREASGPAFALVGCWPSFWTVGLATAWGMRRASNIKHAYDPPVAEVLVACDMWGQEQFYAVPGAPCKSRGVLMLLQDLPPCRGCSRSLSPSPPASSPDSVVFLQRPEETISKCILSFVHHHNQISRLHDPQWILENSPEGMHFLL